MNNLFESLDAWHSDEVRGNKVYFADAVKEGIKDLIDNVEVDLENFEGERTDYVKLGIKMLRTKLKDALEINHEEKQ